MGGGETFFTMLRSDESLEIEGHLGGFSVDKIFRWALATPLGLFAQAECTARQARRDQLSPRWSLRLFRRPEQSLDGDITHLYGDPPEQIQSSARGDRALHAIGVADMSMWSMLSDASTSRMALIRSAAPAMQPAWPAAEGLDRRRLPGERRHRFVAPRSP
jgi:hypothetical protein